MAKADKLNFTSCHDRPGNCGRRGSGVSRKYLQACLEEAGDDAAFIAKALGVIARAKGMTGLARDTGLGRESLYKALSEEGNPSFATILKVSQALGLRWTVVAA